ncbi:unnamed protein product, partial [Prorocentrum cordatum]
SAYEAVLPGDVGRARGLPTLGYRLSANSAEADLDWVLGADLPAHGMRGKRPKLIWKSALKPAGKVKDPRLRSITWLAAQLRARRSYMLCDGAVLSSAGRNVALDVVRVPGEVAVQADSDWHRVFQASAGRPSDDGFHCDLGGSSIPAALADIRSDLGALLDVVDQACLNAKAAASAKAKAAWQDWVREGLDKGDRNAQRAIKDPEPWTPSTTLTAGGIVAAGPMSLLRAEADKFASIWGAGEGLGVDDSPRKPLPVLDPSELRTLSKEYRLSSAVSVDGFHGRHFALLCDEALHCLAHWFCVMEATGILPLHISWVLMARPLAGPEVGIGRVANLGVDIAAGRSIRAPGRGRAAKLKARSATVLRKTRGLKSSGAVLGRRSLEAFASGHLAGGTYGSDVLGVSDRGLLDLRRAAVSRVKPRSQGRSLAVLSLRA